MKELGEYCQPEHQRLLELVQELNRILALLIGKEFENIEAPENVHFFELHNNAPNT
jgi:UDP-N-acetylmuramyl pentapeptide synthase